MGASVRGRQTGGVRRLLVVAAAFLTLTALTTVLDASADAARVRHAPLVDAGVLVIGDSIAWRAHAYVIRGSHRPPRWSVDAFPGRRLTALTSPYGPKVRYPAATTDSYWKGVGHIVVPRSRHRISTAVLELGTNGADTVLDVEQVARMYAAQIRSLRARDIWNDGPRRIVLVTPWRDPRMVEGAVSPGTGRPYPPYMWANKSAVYRRAMHLTADRFRNVRVADWYLWAKAHPRRFPDGVHPDVKGLRAWRDIVFGAIGTKRR